jgi:hypothetical protein
VFKGELIDQFYNFRKGWEVMGGGITSLRSSLSSPVTYDVYVKKSTNDNGALRRRGRFGVSRSQKHRLGSS